VSDSRGAADQPTRLGARTRSTVLAQAGIIAAGACLLTLEFALTFGWSDWLLAVAPPTAMVPRPAPTRAD
jgi:hypothetical protein